MFAEKLRSTAGVVEVRSAGLVAGVQVEDVERVLVRLRESGVLTRAVGRPFAPDLSAVRDRRGRDRTPRRADRRGAGLAERQAPGGYRASVRRPLRQRQRPPRLRGDGGHARVGQAHELARIELELKPAPPGRDEDRLVRERALVDGRGKPRRSPSGLIPPATYPVVRSASARSARVTRLPTARGRAGRRPEARTPRASVDRGEQRLVQPPRWDTECLGDGHGVIALADLDAVVLVQPVVDR